MTNPPPAPLSPWEHLQSTLIRVHNQRVRGYFRSNEEDLGDINTPSGSVLRACLIVDDDSQLQVLNRQLFFWFQVGAIRELIDPIVGTPLADFQQGKKYRPTITLNFEQDADSVAEGSRPLTAQVSFGANQISSLSITEAQLNNLARDIKREFGSAKGLVWSKGKYLCTYKDEDGQFNNQIYALNPVEAQDILRKICQVLDKPFDDDLFTSHEPRRSNTTPTGTVTVLAKSRKKPKWRPNGRVRFKSASIKLWPLPTPIYLVSTPWRHPEALEFLDY